MNPHYENICVIGTGGTGGNLIPSLARLISHLPTNVPKLLIIDNDLVETQNCQRQNFIHSDIGRYKAQVLAERYSGAFGIPIYFKTERLNKKNFWQIIPKQNTLIIDAVDNLTTRVLIHKQLMSKSADISTVDWISLGNTDTYGQMVFYSMTYFGSYARDLVNVFPDDYNVFALRKEQQEDRALRANCALNAIAKPQSLAINILAANIALNLLYQIYYDKEHPQYDIVIFDRFNNVKKINKGQNPFVVSNDTISLLEDAFSTLQET